MELILFNDNLDRVYYVVTVWEYLVWEHLNCITFNNKIIIIIKCSYIILKKKIIEEEQQLKIQIFLINLNKCDSI